MCRQPALPRGAGYDLVEVQGPEDAGDDALEDLEDLEDCRGKGSAAQ